MAQPTERALVPDRFECLTSAKRYHLALLDHYDKPGADPEPPKPGGYQTGVRADRTLTRVPTDGLPDGSNAVRPCPYFTCKYHVALEYNQTTGAVSVMWTAPERQGRGMHTDYVTDEAGDHLVDELVKIQGELRQWEASPAGRVVGAVPPRHLQTCALDLADEARENGVLTLEQVGAAQRKTRERIRQVTDAGFEVLSREGTLAEHAERAVNAALDPLVYPDGHAYRVHRRSKSNVVVDCTHPGCGRRFSAREGRLLAMPSPLCAAHRDGAGTAP